MTIVFGSHPTFMPEYCLEKKSINIIVRLEPEYIIRDIVSNMVAGNSWKQVLGIGFAENGQRDETFTANKKRTKEICQGMIDKRLDLT